jgi:hypothetical protein
LPSLPWLIGVAGLVAVATAWVLRGSVRLAVMLPVLVVGQLGLHAALASLSPAGHGHLHHMAASSPWWAEELAPRMVVTHLLCAALTAVVWWVRRSVVAVVLALVRASTAGASRPRSAAQARTELGRARVWLSGDPGRAPPRVLAPA